MGKKQWGQSKKSHRFYAMSIAVAIVSMWKLSTHFDFNEFQKNILPGFETQDNTLAFQTWFRKGGGVVSNIDLVYFDGMGKGIVAKADIMEKEQVLSVPRKLVMTRDLISKEAPKGLREVLKNQPIDNEVLAVFLMYEKMRGTNSKWFPYLNVLPENICTPSYTFTANEILEIDDEELIQLIENTNDQIRQNYEQLVKIIEPYFKRFITPLSLDLYRWAKSIVSSRALTIHGSQYLVPYADMFNGKPHSLQRDANNGAQFLDYHVIDENHVRIFADRNCEKGSQLFEDYGDNDNYVYFLNHGFIMPNNSFDCTWIPLPKLQSLEDANDIQQKKEALKLLQLPNKISACYTIHGKTLNYAANKYLQVYTSSPSTIDKCMQRKHECSLILNNELNLTKVHIVLQVQAEIRYNKYQTTLEQDTLSMIHNKLMSSNSRIIFEFRISRKLLLLQLIAYLKETQTPSTTVVADAVKQVQSEVSSIKLDTNEVVKCDTCKTKLDTFNTWIVQHAFLPKKVRVKYINTKMGYGTFATENISLNEIYLGVPVTIVLNSMSANDCPTLRPVFDDLYKKTARKDPTNELLIHLMYEKFIKQSTSYWFPYLNILPDFSMLTSPAVYSEELLQIIEYTDLYENIREYRQHITDSFKSLQRVVFQKYPSVFPQDVFTFKNYQWARIILDTRTIWWENSRHLVPVLDMINCMEGPQPELVHSTELSENKMHAITKAKWGFKKDEQIYENYGQPNYIYSLYHGFVLSSNSKDCALLRFNFDMSFITSQELKKSFVERLKAARVNSLTPEFCIKPDQQIPPQLSEIAEMYNEIRSIRKGIVNTSKNNNETPRDHPLRQVLKEKVEKLSSIVVHFEGIEPKSFSEEMISQFLVQQESLLNSLLTKLKNTP